MDTHFVSSKHRKGMAFDAEINDHTVTMDSAAPGIQSGVSPKRLMLASLAGCTGIDVVSILEKMKVEFSNFSIDIEGTLSEAHPRIYEKVKINYYISMTETDRSKMAKAVNLSQEKYCGVSAMFRAFSKIETEIIFR